MKTMQQIVKELDDIVLVDSKHPDRLYKRYRDNEEKREDSTVEVPTVYKEAQAVIDNRSH